MVKFDRVHLFEFPPALGDNPSVSSGVPVALSPNHDMTVVINIDKYERGRKPRRYFDDLLLDQDLREEM